MPLLKKAQNDGLLTVEQDRVIHSDQGWRFLDNLIERFLAEEA
jgi:coproporphyrinogen III oxidase-like Fe-S oxidoreductase